ncbi:MAG TPA: SDR family oxidoreductase, partial [Candidatus Cybelea sp.]
LGKHAVVTGASRGIGHAIAMRLANAGARVSIVSRSAVEGERFFHAHADVADEAQIQKALAACRVANGPIGILVNNAGIAESATLARTTTSMWQGMIAVNLTATFLCMREVVDEMKAAGWGRIVNVASTAGLGGAPYLSAYCASKHGVVGLTRAAAAELAKVGVTVNALCPGYTESAILDRAIANITAKTGKSADEARAILAQSNPQGRIASADEVAQATLECIEGDRSGLTLVIPAPTSS